MIGCTNCGTLNRKGSKYCSNCGQRLQTSPGIVCPACNRLNASDSAFCKYCGASLDTGMLTVSDGIPAEPALEPEAMAMSGDLVPAISPPAAELPDWLYPEPQQPAPGSSSAPHVTPSVANAPQGVESRYLKDIPGILPTADAWLNPPQQISKQPTPASTDQTQESKPQRHQGSLPFGVAILLGTWTIFVRLFSRSVLLVKP